MERSQFFSAMCMALALCTSPLALAKPGAKDSADSGSVSLTARYRFESVDDDNLARNGEASTIRTRLALRSPSVGRFSAYLELDDVRTVGPDDYNSTRNGLTQFPVIADPEGFGVNQLFVQYRSDQGNSATLGRQRINLDNQRFIGSVAWRQNEQTFDALTIDYKPTDWVSVYYGYLDQVNRIFGPDNGRPAKSFDSDSHILNVAFSDLPVGKVSAYGYWLDFDNAAALSSETLGVRLTGKQQLSDSLRIDYQAEWAHQSDYGDNPTNYSANYGLLELAAQYNKIRASAGVEILGADSDAGVSFQTPLATLHKFQGWADRFLNTPGNGIEDTYFSVGTTVAGFAVSAIYHDYQSESGNQSFGTELGLIVRKGFGSYGNLLVKYSNYDEDGFSADVEKLWAQYSLTIK